MDFSKKLVSLIIFMNVVFCIAVLVVFWHTSSEPSALVVAWFAFTGTELVSLASIKKKKIEGDSYGADFKESE
jgi:hypothetical protein